MSDINKYKQLSDIEHVKIRPGMYLGNTSNTTASCYIPIDGKMELQEVTYNPALLKMFDEIISNSVDEHIRSGKVKRIKIDINEMTESITLEDDGGIPVEIHPEYDKYIPTMIFGELRTGSNFDDDSRLGAGMNGLGAKLTSIFSSEFKLMTGDGKNRLRQTFSNGLKNRTDPVINPSPYKGTKIEFTPDYEILGCSMDEGNVNRIMKRVYDVAGCNPKIKVYFNGSIIKVSNFKEYAGMYCDSDKLVEFKNKDWNVIAAPNEDDTFKQISFVNGVDTFNGGTHIDYITNQITNYLREHIKKKNKIDVKPNNIKQQLMIFINCSVNAPIFTSQTKEFMSLDSKDYGTECVLSDKFMKELINSEVLQKVLDWVEAEERRKDLAELRKLTKQTQNNNFLKKIVKFDDASNKNRQECTFVLTEGDSASKSILSARDPKKIGVFPLRGKPLNVRDIKISRLTTNQEFASIMAIIGLRLGHDDLKISDLRFSKVVLATDFDPDGSHICGLIVNMFQQFWPELLKEGLLYRLRTPLIVATKGKKEFEFFSRSSYNEWAENNPGHSMFYYKGLGSWSTKKFKKFMEEDEYLVKLECNGEEDFKSIDLAFDKRLANDRKQWLLEEHV